MSETLSDTNVDTAPELDIDANTEANAPPPSPAAETAPETQRQGDKVPLATLMEERAALKREREANKALREQFETGNKRLEMLLASFQQAQPQRQAEPTPDINTDPVGFFQRENQTLRQELDGLKQFREQFEQRGQQTVQEVNFLNAYRTDAMTFSQKTPDFTPAYNHFKEVVIRDALESGADPEEAVAEMEAQERKLVDRALRNGKSPAEAVYNAAKRYGFKATAQASPDAKMDAMQRGQSAARSTSASGARGRYDGLSIESLAAMSEAEFAKVPQSIVNRLLGGPG